MAASPGSPGASRANPLAILVHGYSCSRNYWSGAQEGLGQNADVELVSLPGHDEMPLPAGRRLDVEACVDHVLGAVASAGDREVYLVGHSLGGMVGLACARRRPRPLTAVVLVDAFPRLGAPPPFDRSFWSGSPPKLKARIVKEMMETRRKLPSSLWESVAAFDAGPYLDELMVPVRGIYGDRGETDHALLHRAIVGTGLGCISDLRLHIVAQAGHFVMLERPQAFYALLAQTLVDLPGR